MSCRACQSDNQQKFSGELNIHFPGWKGLDKPTVMVFPEIVLCFNCGYADFEIADTELRLLAEGIAENGAVA